MAIFSEGGTSHPDILIVCYMITCSVISSLLNPAVFIYNYWRKKNSVPVFLFRCLAVFDFLTCIFIPVKVATEAVKQECFISIEDDIHEYENPCILRRRPVIKHSDMPLKLYSLVAWVLILTPSFIAAVMAICRFIQIKFPFYPLQLRHPTIAALVYGTYTICLSGYVAFHSDSEYLVQVQVLVNLFEIPESKLYLNILIFVWPSIVCQILSVVTSILTILHLHKIGKEAIAQQSAFISRRSSLKILVTNFAGIFNNIGMISAVAIAKIYYGYYSSQSPIAITQLGAVNFLPVFLSCLNPVIFIVFTPKFRVSPRTRPSVS